MKISRLAILCPLAVILLLAMSSCDPISSLDCDIYNKTSDTVTITMYKDLMSSSYMGYSIVENDSVTTHYEADSCNVAVLAPDQVLKARYDWSGLYREDFVAPLWRYIKSIKSGDVELAPALWNNEAAWSLKVKGGGRFEGESRYYTLILRDR